MSKRALWKFEWHVGRMGTVRGLFVATDEEVEKHIGADVYFGEILGKHSEIYGTIERDDLKRLTDDEAFISKFEEYGCASGYNPLEYLREDEEEETEEEDDE
jgi:hypothetical protein